MNVSIETTSGENTIQCLALNLIEFLVAEVLHGKRIPDTWKIGGEVVSPSLRAR